MLSDIKRTQEVINKLKEMQKALRVLLKEHKDEINSEIEDEILDAEVSLSQAGNLISKTLEKMEYSYYSNFKSDKEEHQYLFSIG